MENVSVMWKNFINMLWEWLLRVLFNPKKQTQILDKCVQSWRRRSAWNHVKQNFVNPLWSLQRERSVRYVKCHVYFRGTSCFDNIRAGGYSWKRAILLLGAIRTNKAQSVNVSEMCYVTAHCLLNYAQAAVTISCNIIWLLNVGCFFVGYFRVNFNWASYPVSF